MRTLKALFYYFKWRWFCWKKPPTIMELNYALQGYWFVHRSK